MPFTAVAAPTRSLLRAGLLSLALGALALPAMAQGLDDILLPGIDGTGGAPAADPGRGLGAVGGAGAAGTSGLPADPMATVRPPRLADPFNPGAGAPDCASLPAGEGEKFGCGAAGAAPAGGAGVATADPFPLPGRAPEGGGAVPPAEAGAGAGTGAGGLPPAEAGGALPPGTRVPLKRADIPDLDRRILTLPGATLAGTPGGEGGGAELPAFSIFYIYGETDLSGQKWLEVGRDARGRVDGWIKAADAEDWQTMLVMQYAPKGNRNRVLFFKQRNDLIDFVRDPHVKGEAKYAYDEIESGDYDDEYFVAIEPAADVDPDKTYLMPILSHRQEIFALGEKVTLVEVAGLNVSKTAEVQADVRDTAVANRDAPKRASALRDFRFGIAFAIDTTASMGPYINHTRAVVLSVMKAFAEKGLLDKVDFGLVGYRDNLSPDRRIEYVTRVFQDLTPGTSPQDVLANFQTMTPSPVPTKDWQEDALAGLEVAVNALNWEPYNLRMVILITDAGARGGGDPLAANPGYDTINLVENAGRRNVAISVMHLVTPEAERYNDVGPARTVYSEISRTGDAATPKYFGVDTRDGQAFLDQINGFASSLTELVETSARGRRVERVEEVRSVGDALVNEVFRAQLEYLGAKNGQEAPRFYRAWAPDKDLINQETRALEVKAFLTRNQLSALKQGAENILSAYERQETGGSDFFESLTQLAAQNAVEGVGTRSLTEAGQLFPSFLKALPYRSKFLTLDAESWRAEGVSKQRELIAELRYKLRAYSEMAADTRNWVDLGAGDRGLEVYPVALDYLP